VAARRRGRGEGSIYRSKDGRWVGQYEVGGKRRYVYGKTRKEVASKTLSENRHVEQNVSAGELNHR
jgi:hypothetical protein